MHFWECILWEYLCSAHYIYATYVSVIMYSYTQVTLAKLDITKKPSSLTNEVLEGTMGEKTFYSS